MAVFIDCFLRLYSTLFRTNLNVLYSLTLIARTTLGPWKFVLGTGSSSHGGSIIAPGHETNVDNSRMSFRTYKVMVSECTR